MSELVAGKNGKANCSSILGTTHVNLLKLSAGFRFSSILGTDLMLSAGRVDVIDAAGFESRGFVSPAQALLCVGRLLPMESEGAQDGRRLIGRSRAMGAGVHQLNHEKL